jgi:hypothetical protein
MNRATRVGGKLLPEAIEKNNWRNLSKVKRSQRDESGQVGGNERHREGSEEGQEKVTLINPLVTSYASINTCSFLPSP